MQPEHLMERHISSNLPLPLMAGATAPQVLANTGRGDPWPKRIAPH